MSYLIARCCDGIGCIAFRIPHGPSLVALKKKLIGIIGYGPVELITISRPQAYLEHAPYHVAATEDEFIRTVIKLYESIKGYSCNAEDAMPKEMLVLRENLLAVEGDRAMGKCGIPLDELDRRLGIVLGEVLL